MSSPGWQIFGLIASVASTAALLLPVFGCIRRTLPSARMNELESLVATTEGLLLTALNDGTISQESYRKDFDERLLIAKGLVDDLRMSVYNIKGSWEELKCWMAGLSKSISTVTEEFTSIRGEVATKSSAGRHEMMNAKQSTDSQSGEKGMPPWTHISLPTSVFGLAYDATSEGRKREQDSPNTGRALLERDRFASPGRSTHPATVAENRRATRHVLVGFGKKLMSPGTGGNGRLLAAAAARRRNDYQSRLRALSGLFYPAPAVLPRHLDASTFGQALMSQTTLPASSGFGWEDSGHVIAQVQLAA